MIEEEKCKSMWTSVTRACGVTNKQTNKHILEIHVILMIFQMFPMLHAMTSSKLQTALIASVNGAVLNINRAEANGKNSTGTH